MLNCESATKCLVRSSTLSCSLGPRQSMRCEVHGCRIGRAMMRTGRAMLSLWNHDKHAGHCGAVIVVCQVHIHVCHSGMSGRRLDVADKLAKAKAKLRRMFRMKQYCKVKGIGGWVQAGGRQ